MPFADEEFLPDDILSNEDSQAETDDPLLDDLADFLQEPAEDAPKDAAEPEIPVEEEPAELEIDPEQDMSFADEEPLADDLFSEEDLLAEDLLPEDFFQDSVEETPETGLEVPAGEDSLEAEPESLPAEPEAPIEEEALEEEPEQEVSYAYEDRQTGSPFIDKDLKAPIKKESKVKKVIDLLLCLKNLTEALPEEKRVSFTLGNKSAHLESVIDSLSNLAIIEEPGADDATKRLGQENGGDINESDS